MIKIINQRVESEVSDECHRVTVLFERDGKRYLKPCILNKSVPEEVLLTMCERWAREIDSREALTK